MICRRACITGKHVLVMILPFMRMCYGRTCVVDGQVLQVCAEATIKLLEFRYVVGVFFFYNSILFALRHAFQEFLV